MCHFVILFRHPLIDVSIRISSPIFLPYLCSLLYLYLPISIPTLFQAHEVSGAEALCELRYPLTRVVIATLQSVIRNVLRRILLHISYETMLECVV